MHNTGDWRSSTPTGHDVRAKLGRFPLELWDRRTPPSGRFQHVNAAARLNLAFAYLKLDDRASATREFHTLCQQSTSLCQQYRSKFE